MNGDVSSLLVANRGEIALRIMRTARAMGLRTIAVHSDVDASALHVRYADAAVCVGPAAAAESYLSIPAILEAARATGATAIHPGYGFLSENSAFAKAVAEAGLTFVGPPVAAIDAMGDKARAKRRMIEAGVPCVPGYEGEDQSEGTLLAAANDIGLPLMVKASAGGGGRGMRLVTRFDDLPAALRTARSEAENAFGNGDLILERAIIEPRHVEIQVFADSHGNVIHLGERDCSVQRRHQKVIEESPCPVMTADLRARMGAAAVEAARAVSYVGAGTVEFLLDKSGSFYFLEMNTRLQVEHPVTEMVTGLDLVALQLQVARGEPLSIGQDDVMLTGHAIEVRLYAEEPEAGFLPSTGHISLFHEPSGPGIRVDSGVATGGEVSPFYDPMIAKIIAYGSSREEARLRLINALGETAVFGPRTNRDFLIDALDQGIFARGEATTAFIGAIYGDKFQRVHPSEKVTAAAAVLHHVHAQRRAASEALSVPAILQNWSSVAQLETIVEFDLETGMAKLSVRPLDQVSYAVGHDGLNIIVKLDSLEMDRARLIADGETIDLVLYEEDATIHVASRERTYSFTNFALIIRDKAAASGQGLLVAPMHGLLTEIFVAEGDRVVQGDRLAILEAMKMQHELVAEVAGSVKRITAAKGTQIAAQDLILEIEADKPDDERN